MNLHKKHRRKCDGLREYQVF